jgi:hypothetical protein
MTERKPAADEGERMSDETVARSTGRRWSEWFAILDDWHGAEKTHTEIARFLSEEHGVPAWEDGRSRVNVYFTAKGDARSSVSVQHERLRDAAEADRMKAMWRERLNELKRALES